jgi:hypothetical protein
VFVPLSSGVHRFNAAGAGISVDGTWCHIAFALEPLTALAIGYAGAPEAVDESIAERDATCARSTPT